MRVLVGWLGVGLVVLGSVLGGCGTPAPPAPPSLNLPAPVLNLSALRVGNTVRLAWTMPTRTTDKVMLRQPVTVEICRAVEDGKCVTLGRVNVAPGKPGAYSDELPEELAHGSDRLLRYEIGLRNHAGKSAGQSNSAFSAAGASPPALTGLTSQMRREGVQLDWQPAPEPGRSVLYRIKRVRLTTGEVAQAPKSPLAASTPPETQTLVVQSPDGRDPGHAIDASAVLNQQYRYTVERVATPVLPGQTVEIQGLPSEAVVVTTTDSFAPGVPQQLAAIADAAGGAIDLSWTPDSENDLMAYYVYRRDVRGGVPAQRIAAVGLETSYRDADTQADHRYAYSVSAVDQSGNESQRCPEVEETLPGR